MIKLKTFQNLEVEKSIYEIQEMLYSLSNQLVYTITRHDELYSDCITFRIKAESRRTTAFYSLTEKGITRDVRIPYVAPRITAIKVACTTAIQHPRMIDDMHASARGFVSSLIQDLVLPLMQKEIFNTHDRHRFMNRPISPEQISMLRRFAERRNKSNKPILINQMFRDYQKHTTGASLRRINIT